jgi:hypothetical protein
VDDAQHHGTSAVSQTGQRIQREAGVAFSVGVDAGTDDR